MAEIIDSLNYGNDTYVFAIPYGECSTAATTAAKTVTLSNFVLETGAQVRIKFTYANSVSGSTLNVNDSGAKPIYWHGAALVSGQRWQAGAVLDFVYNGTQWDLVSIAKDNNTTYSVATTSSDGLMSSSDKEKLDNKYPGCTWYYLVGTSNHGELFNSSSNVASGYYSHAEGLDTTASSNSSHAEGYTTTASGPFSHAEGSCTEASGLYSHAEGYCTTANANQHVQGHYNSTSTGGTGGSGTSGSAFIIGNGTDSSSLSNAFRVSYAGKPYALSSLNTSGADYAEFFEWQDSNPNDEDRRGYFVTLDGDKIKMAEPNDYVLGVISALPAVIGNGDEDWRGRYILDDFGAFITEEFEYDLEEPVEVVDEETGETKIEMKITKKTGTKYKENPEYDPSTPYIQREDRPEWDTVGMMGVLAVRDDGSCRVNGYCKVAEGGVATVSDSGYRVIARVNDNVVKIVFR